MKLFRQQVGDVKKTDLPGLEALALPGEVARPSFVHWHAYRDLLDPSINTIRFVLPQGKKPVK